MPLPAGLAVSLASAGDNVVDGWRTVSGPLSRRPEAPVLVVGGLARSVGLYAVDAALALGADSVTYVDDDPHGLRWPPISAPRWSRGRPPNGWDRFR